MYNQINNKLNLWLLLNSINSRFYHNGLFCHFIFLKSQFSKTQFHSRETNYFFKHRFYLICVIILFLKSIFSRHKPIKDDIMTDRKESFFHSCNLFSFSFFSILLPFKVVWFVIVGCRGYKVVHTFIVHNRRECLRMQAKRGFNRYVERKRKLCTH